MDIVCGGLFGVLLLTIGLWVLISRRYGGDTGLAAVPVIAVVSIAIAALYAVLANNEPFPPVEWRQVTLLSAAPTHLEYRPNQGILASTATAEFLLTPEMPVCFSSGDIAQWNEWAAKNYPNEFVVEPEVEDGGLSAPPDSPAFVVTVRILYPVDTDADGMVSYAVYADGAVWCTERLSRGGPAGFVEAGARGFAILVVAAMICFGCFAIGTMLTAITLGILLRRRKAAMRRVREGLRLTEDKKDDEDRGP